MSLTDENLPFASFIQEEMIDSLNQALTQFLEQLPSVARLRLLAFMHLMEHVEMTKASLEVSPSGSLRLILDTAITPCHAHQH